MGLLRRCAAVLSVCRSRGVGRHCVLPLIVSVAMGLAGCSPARVRRNVTPMMTQDQAIKTAYALLDASAYDISEYSLVAVQDRGEWQVRCTRYAPNMSDVLVTLYTFVGEDVAQLEPVARTISECEAVALARRLVAAVGLPPDGYAYRPLPAGAGWRVECDPIGLSAYEATGLGPHTRVWVDDLGHIAIYTPRQTDALEEAP